MSFRTNGRIRSAVVLTLWFAAASCSGSDGADPSTTVSDTAVSVPDGDGLTANAGSTVAATTIPLPDCEGVAVTVPADWPFGVADAVVPTATSRDGELFLVQGVTNQPEAVLASTIDDAFPGFDVDEPTGGDNDISVRFTSLGGTGDLRMADDDTDGCWDVELAALYEPGAAPPSENANEPSSSAAPATPDDEAATSEPVSPASGSVDDGVPAVASTVAPPEVIDPLDQINAVGTGEVITGRSTFQVQLTTCDIDPLLIEAVAVGGTLTIAGDPSGVTTTWTYDDGVVISSNESKVLGVDARGGTVVADGQNAEGPETIFATFLCTTG